MCSVPTFPGVQVVVLQGVSLQSEYFKGVGEQRVFTLFTHPKSIQKNYSEHSKCRIFRIGQFAS